MSTNFHQLIRQIVPYLQLEASGGSLASNTRAFYDVPNDGSLSPDGDTEATPFIEFQFSTGPPAADLAMVSCWHLRGTGEVTERFAEGGDGTGGTADIDPQAVHFIGAFSLSDPSTSGLRVASLAPIRLASQGNRFVLKNVSGNTIAAGWNFGMLIERFRIDQV